MEQAWFGKLLEIQQKELGEERYRELLLEYETADRRMVEILPTLTRQQQDAVMDYIAVLAAVHLWTLERALGEEEGMSDAAPVTNRALDAAKT